ncbi:MAG: ArsR/SmtB family transcription factor [Ilumatobacteraceae bacterium]
MPQRSAELDLVFQALADPTRRGVVERLVSGSVATRELARPFDMALPSFIQHLGVLERAGLVTSTKQGRVRTYRLSTDALDRVDGWLNEQRGRWEQRLDQLDELLLTTANSNDDNDDKTSNDNNNNNNNNNKEQR